MFTNKPPEDNQKKTFRSPSNIWGFIVARSPKKRQILKFNLYWLIISFLVRSSGTEFSVYFLFRARIAQLVEQLALNQTVGGSNPSARTSANWKKLALVAQWIEQESSKLLMGVRFPPRAQILCAREYVSCFTCVRDEKTGVMHETPRGGVERFFFLKNTRDRFPPRAQILCSREYTH